MALDPNLEDFQRLSLRYAATLDLGDPFDMARKATEFSRRFAQKRDSLPQTDEDRAFGLVCQAAHLIDYELPFATAISGPQIIREARKLLTEALELDPDCPDARRMIASADSKNPTAYHDWLAQDAPAVRAQCERARDAALEAAAGAEGDYADMARATALLAMRPYLRWVVAESSTSLICGRYRLAIAEGEEALAIEPGDPADVSHTLALAYAKLEDEEGYGRLLAAAEPTHGAAWYSLARIALLYKQERREEATREVKHLLDAYPNAGTTLGRQDDLPEGVYARICVEPMSEDELILATSEATVLLQEGCDAHERGSLGSWLANLPEVLEAQKRELAADPTLGEEEQ